MDDFRLSAAEATEMARQMARGMAGQPPWCDGPECYLHDGDGEEHHVEPCPMYGTFAQASHRLDDELRPAVAAIKAELRKTAEGRLVIRYVEIRAWIAVRVHRARWRLYLLRLRIFGR